MWHVWLTKIERRNWTKGAKQIKFQRMQDTYSWKLKLLLLICECRLYLSWWVNWWVDAVNWMARKSKVIWNGGGWSIWRCVLAFSKVLLCSPNLSLRCRLVSLVYWTLHLEHFIIALTCMWLSKAGFPVQGCMQKIHIPVKTPIYTHTSRGRKRHCKSKVSRPRTRRTEHRSPATDWILFERTPNSDYY